MQSEHIQTIQNLIKTTAVLTSAEKSEWLELVDLMNDRQLLELERILEDANKNQESRIKSQEAKLTQAGVSLAQVRPAIPSAIPKSTVPTAKPLPLASPQFSQNDILTPGKKELSSTSAIVKSSKIGAGPVPPAPKKLPIAQEPGPGPSFKHILNFPKAGGPFDKAQGRLERSRDGGGGATFPPSAGSLPLPQVRLESKTIEPKKESPFLSKLKAIFSEKELPPPPQIPPGDILISGKKDFSKPSTVVASSKIGASATGHTDKLAASKTSPKPLSEYKKSEARPKPSPKLEQPASTTINIFMNKGEPAKFSDLEQVVKAIQRPSESSPILGKSEPAEADLSAPAPIGASQPPQPKISYEPAAHSAQLRAAPSMAEGAAAAVSTAMSAAKAASAVAPSAAEAEAVSPAPTPWNQEESGLYKPNKKPDSGAVAAKTTATQQGLAPGLNFSEGPSAAALKSRLMTEPGPGPNKQASSAVSASGRIILQEKPGDNMKLETLNDVTALKPDDLQKHATGTLFRKCQKLISQYGPHEVVFRLEQSPLYKAYINTGVAWLKEGARKAQGVATLQLPGEDFERFVDFLIMLRSRA